MKEGEGISQRICMHNLQTQMTVWCWTEGRGGGQREKNGDINNNVNNKKRKYYLNTLTMHFQPKHHCIYQITQSQVLNQIMLK